MPTNPNDAAFARPYNAVEGEYSSEQSGLTKREYAAMHAPEMPNWFRRKFIEQFPVERPEYLSNEELVEMIGEEAAVEELANLSSWLRDPCYDLPDHMRWYQAKVEEWWRNQDEWNQFTAESRVFFLWRSYYADTLFTKLNKEVGC